MEHCEARILFEVDLMDGLYNSTSKNDDHKGMSYEDILKFFK